MLALHCCCCELPHICAPQQVPFYLLSPHKPETLDMQHRQAAQAAATGSTRGAVVGNRVLGAMSRRTQPGPVGACSWLPNVFGVRHRVLLLQICTSQCLPMQQAWQRHITLLSASMHSRGSCRVCPCMCLPSWAIGNRQPGPRPEHSSPPSSPSVRDTAGAAKCAAAGACMCRTMHLLHASCGNKQ